MATKVTNSECKKCRSAGEKLFLKGEKCFSPKCTMVKRDYAPGAHGANKKPSRVTVYGGQLKEKQKAKRIYGLRETQFSNYVAKATGRKGNTADELIKSLEMRLDNVIFRLGLAKSRPMARQIVSHMHILVDGKKVNIPSFQVKPNQVITIVPKILEKGKLFTEIMVNIGKRELPSWVVLETNKADNKISGKILSDPKVAEMTLEFDPKKIIEFYSR